MLVISGERLKEKYDYTFPLQPANLDVQLETTIISPNASFDSDSFLTNNQVTRKVTNIDCEPGGLFALQCPNDGTIINRVEGRNPYLNDHLWKANDPSPAIVHSDGGFDSTYTLPIHFGRTASESGVGYVNAYSGQFANAVPSYMYGFWGTATNTSATLSHGVQQNDKQQLKFVDEVTMEDPIALMRFELVTTVEGIGAYGGVGTVLTDVASIAVEAQVLECVGLPDEICHLQVGNLLAGKHSIVSMGIGNIDNAELNEATIMIGEGAGGRTLTLRYVNFSY